MALACDGYLASIVSAVFLMFGSSRAEMEALMVVDLIISVLLSSVDAFRSKNSLHLPSWLHYFNQILLSLFLLLACCYYFMPLSIYSNPFKVIMSAKLFPKWHEFIEID